MFRLGADATASSAHFERLNEFFIYIPNDEISHSSTTGTTNDSNDNHARAMPPSVRRRDTGLNKLRWSVRGRILNLDIVPQSVLAIMLSSAQEFNEMQGTV
jgi:hypothetical protein